ncbi:GNAT family N-acetyltransferase [Parapedobacter koreensis]|uniref:L-amino acid N-acyltransferase YncA n=1 Tax=Parapedobacter koreensis TaxID=332977 RepID=A0A1H7TRK1_9SPHI|nr:GNAT family N-acetyltransferase [Parapedobacter koreensis]SEL87054.1 L-amino acid N-acyltransferase YncA [Parapedobacter koreensis]
MKTIIRKAVAADCPQLLELVRELAAYEKAPEAVTVSLEEFVDAGFGNAPVWEAFVAEAGGRLVGMSLFYIRYSTWKGRRLYLEDIIVTEKMRGKGIGKLLFDETWKLCEERQYKGMVWQVLEWNEPAINFYKKYGASFDSEWVNVSLDSLRAEAGNHQVRVNQHSNEAK